MGNASRKINQLAGKQAHFDEKTGARLVQLTAIELWAPRPNAVRATKEISHGSNSGFGEKSGTVASALVLRRDAQNVRKRSDACEGPDAFAGVGVGRNRNGSRSRSKTSSFVAVHPIRKNPRSGTYRLSVLS